MILPDASTSPRWEANDRPLLKASFTAAGISADIQNADGDKSKFGTICDGMINAGVNVLLIVNLDSDSGCACLKKAQAAGIKTIDYDRLTLGGGASYYVSFDNVAVGSLMGTGLQKCLTEARPRPTSSLINGDPTDNNATLFKQGYVAALKPKVDSGAYKIVGDQTGKWDATIAGTAFEQLYTQNKGKIDGVISANDTMAGGIIARLKANKLNGKVPVTGQDASVEGLQGILARQPVHDGLQGHQEGGRRGLPAGDRPDQGHGREVDRLRQGHRHRPEEGRPVGAGDAGRDLQGQRQGRHRGRLPEEGGRLHRGLRWRPAPSSASSRSPAHWARRNAGGPTAVGPRDWPPTTTRTLRRFMS